jgi:hypothetical protein
VNITVAQGSIAAINTHRDRGEVRVTIIHCHMSNVNASDSQALIRLGGESPVVDHLTLHSCSGARFLSLTRAQGVASISNVFVVDSIWGNPDGMLETPKSPAAVVLANCQVIDIKRCEPGCVEESSI